MMHDPRVTVDQPHGEGGWGYAIVGSGFVVSLFLIGLFQVQSLFFVEWQREFNTTSLEASLMTSMFLLVLGLASKYMVCMVGRPPG